MKKQWWSRLRILFSHSLHSCDRSGSSAPEVFGALVLAPFGVLMLEDFGTFVLECFSASLREDLLISLVAESALGDALFESVSKALTSFLSEWTLVLWYKIKDTELLVVLFWLDLLLRVGLVSLAPLLLLSLVSLAPSSVFLSLAQLLFTFGAFDRFLSEEISRFFRVVFRFA